MVGFFVAHLHLCIGFMGCRVWSVLFALLSLLSLDFAFTTKETQTLGENLDFSALHDVSDSPSQPPITQDEFQDALSGLIQKMVDATAIKKKKVRLIHHGSVKIRLQIPASDFDTMFCVTRVASPINHLAIAKCQYTADQFFTYNVDAGTLQSYGAEDEGFWVPAQTIPTELQDQFKGKIPFVLSETQPESPQKWNVRVPSTDKISFVTDDPFVNFCMQTSINGWSMKLFAKKLRSLWGACSAMHVVTPEDDEMAGRIVQFRWDSSTRSVVQECVTFDETTVLPDSALVLRACVAGATNQQFTYNIITKHLRTAVNNAVLFFWWRGPIKALEDLSDEEEGYGWTIPLRRPGSVVAVDHRGYSGVCWASRSGRIIAAQSCGTFAMLPTTETYLYRVLSQAHSYQSVYVMTQNSAQNVTECLTIRRIPQTERGKLLDEKVLWDFLFSACNFDRLEQRFILVSPIQNPCTNRSCYGTLRWAGDYNIMVVPFYADPYDMVSDARLVGGSMSEYEYTFHFPYQRFDRIRVTRKAQKYQNHTACVGRRRYISLLSGNFTRCPLFTVVPTSQLPPDSLDQVTIIARYDYRWMVALPNDRSIKQNNRARLDLKRELSQDFTDNFGRNFDYFIGDLGVRGIRRFRALGSGLHPQPSGEIRANTKADTPNGISLPLLFQDVHNHPYISIDLYLRVNRAQIQRRTHNSFLLMSFARSSGCVVYVTYTGKPGIRCYLSSAVFASDQVLTWPQDLFDGQFHKVSVVFSANTRSGVVQLYIDGQLISDLTRNKRWSLFNTGENVAFFYDPHFWEFAPLPGSLLRASVVGSDNLTRIQEIATRQVLSYQPFQGDVESIEKVPELKTVWSDCALIRGSGVHYEGLECSITAQQDGETVTVPQDVFSLGCSRPGCTITFLPHQPKLADRYRFIYKPHYPKGFVSENVGDPALFHDPAKLTDGFQTRTASFGLKFSPTATVDDTQEGAAQDPTAGENMLELANGDFMSYVCVQSCCGQVSGLAVQDQEAIF
eukprot:TRINITY_DN9221_c0_g1_i10.p1 TRINITY_DN9221_c0_g1~~TRINITY_DN9221_c0_g1_i10.p1  ORF type:complete len:1013 (-),score=213.63 TRINITY_DN9221_c0_g1_i10:99-3137(-)